MIMNKSVLLVGATGMLGGQIGQQLMNRPNLQLRLLLRSADKDIHNDRIKPLLARGAEFVEGDLSDRASLDRATEGMSVIISAVQGGPDVIIDGQVALAEAGKRNGARRIFPSDYAMDLFKATPGEHMMFDLRRNADDTIAKLGIEHVHVLQGAFMDMFRPGSGMFDYDAGVVQFWGDGNQIIDCTSVESTAAMVAHAAFDPDISSGKFAFAGDRISILDATKIIEARTGKTFERRSLGSEADLRAAMAAAALDKSNPFMSVMLAYHLYMLNGQTALTDLQNTRYPDVKLETFADFAERNLARV
jgi:nucleoside-diphosphate-sugar epimerase